MPASRSIHEALKAFAAAVTAKMTRSTSGEPEAQLRGPFENLLGAVAEALGWNLRCVDEAPVPDRVGKPDYAILMNDLLAGYVELKAPGLGAVAARFRGHNREQFKRFSAIPNLLYTDGNEWALYRGGELAGEVVRLSGDVACQGPRAATADNARALERLIRDFLGWRPIIPTDRRGLTDLRGFAAMLAPLTRLLRDDVTEALANPASPLAELAGEWRQLLFPEASDEQFADAYAQTVTFALLLGRSEGADPLTLRSAEEALRAQHNLLSRALAVLTDPTAEAEIAVSLKMILRVIAAVPTGSLGGSEDPWLYFYEDFLAAYDPDLRKDAGAYYTPVEVVRCQVRLVDELLAKRLNRPLGFADAGVVTLDPAVGTGTYLLGIIEHALGRVEAEEGPGAVAARASELARNLFGFELMVGPYAVSELRVSRALRDRGGVLPPEGTHVYLTDTLESPHAVPPVLPIILRPIADQHAKALRVKSRVPVIVCLGNPPYDRHAAATAANKARTGGWVRWGETGEGADALFRAFLDPAIASGHGVHVKNLYNLYVYFWRWALWKVFEQPSTPGPGVVSFITASSYLDGDAFCGMREHMRRVCDEIWILDLGGEGRGTRRSENVFAIQTPVAIAVACRVGEVDPEEPAVVRYARIEGTREEKLAVLDRITGLRKLKWQECPEAWAAPFRPAGTGDYFSWPLLTDLMPWQHSGCEIKRTWPICHDPETLRARWRGLLAATDRAAALKETRDRTLGSACRGLFEGEGLLPPLGALPPDTPPPRIERYAYRSFDRQWLFADTRLGDYLRPDLWGVLGDRQVYLTSLFNHPLGFGPPLTACSSIPDRHHLRGSYGGKDVLPFYRTEDASEANILPGLLGLLAKACGCRITPEASMAYLYGIMAHPAFTVRFRKELETRELRVPITRDRVLFERARDLGARLLWLHTYGERYVPRGRRRGEVPRGDAQCAKRIPATSEDYPDSFAYDEATGILRVGEGEFAPVVREVYEFEVSGLKVVQSWLKYRMRRGAGKKSSPLDDVRPQIWTGAFTTELLHLLWVLEATLAVYPEQARLLDAVVEGDCIKAAELPPVPETKRKPPRSRTAGDDIFEADTDA